MTGDIIRILLIRHGQTAGNLQGRYVGRTDEDLCPEGIRKLHRLIRSKKLAAVTENLPLKGLFASPMKRCVQTAQILFPDMPVSAISGMQECDFGAFEYHNYRELQEDTRYQAWIDSQGTLPFPEGEDPQQFRNRVCRAFESMMARILREARKPINSAVQETALDKNTRPADRPGSESSQEENLYALVCHGGCIMAIMDRYSCPHRDYFDWQIGNGESVLVQADLPAWERGSRYLYYMTEKGRA